MKQKILKKICMIAVMVLALMPAAPASAETNVPEPKTAATDIVYEDETDIEDNQTPQTGMDPFSYNVPTNSRGFLPSTSGAVPTGIRVLGIMCLAGQKPLAALKFPGYDEPFFVKENDLIAVSTWKSARIRTGKNRNAQKNAKKEITYVQVGIITKSQVELFPKTNPSNVQILR